MNENVRSALLVFIDLHRQGSDASTYDAFLKRGIPTRDDTFPLKEQQAGAIVGAEHMLAVCWDEGIVVRMQHLVCFC